MENVQRTIYAAYIQTCKELNMPIDYFSFTTLNQALGIQSNYTYPATTNPYLNYFVIGNGGNVFTTGAGGLEQPTPIQHQATDANLYNIIPFVLRTLNNDLTTSEMANYRLRNIITINGTQYAAYYARLINFSNTAIQLNNIVDNNGLLTTSPFVPSSVNMNPTAVPLTSLSANTVSGNYVSVSALCQLIFTANEVAEFLNVCSILYNNQYASIISEVGVCSGFDIPATGQAINGTTISYTEAVGVTINAFVNTFYAMYYSQNGLNITFDVGANEPLLNLQVNNA